MANSDIVDMYSTDQQGGELPYFIGKQTGTGWFRALGRFAIPILKKLGLTAAKAATSALAATATDVLAKNKSFLPSLKENTMSAVNENLPTLKKDAVEAIESIGKRRKTINNRSKTYGTIFQK